MELASLFSVVNVASDDGALHEFTDKWRLVSLSGDVLSGLFGHGGDRSSEARRSSSREVL